jgi:integrase
MTEDAPIARKPLTHTRQIDTAKPEEKTYSLNAGDGLFLEVLTTGAKRWRYRYSLAGKRGLLSLGIYPAVGLADAKAKRDEYNRLLAQGIKPSDQRKQEKQDAKQSDQDTFAYIGRQWLSDQEGAVKPYTQTRNRRMLENDLIPLLGHKPMRIIKSSDILAVGKQVESRGALEVARRVIRLAGTVFRYAMRHDLADHDPTTGLTEALKPRKVENMARVSKQDLPELLHKIDHYDGDILTRIGLQMIAYTGVRTKELREMEWADIDVNAALWRIPAHKMKMEYPHIVPLSRQVLALLEQLKPITGHKPYVFQSYRTHKPISENTLIYAIYRMGYKSRMTVHGFRGVFATELYEQGYMSDAIERQLAHQEGNQVKAAYNHAQHLPYRVKMMQEWSDYLDSIRVGKIVAFPKATA